MWQPLCLLIEKKNSWSISILSSVHNSRNILDYFIFCFSEVIYRDEEIVCLCFSSNYIHERFPVWWVTELIVHTVFLFMCVTRWQNQRVTWEFWFLSFLKTNLWHKMYQSGFESPTYVHWTSCFSCLIITKYGISRSIQATEYVKPIWVESFYSKILHSFLVS